jgi:uncharacterized protein
VQDKGQSAVHTRAGLAVASRTSTPVGISRKPNLIYDLRRGSGDSNTYYADSAEFTNEVLAEIERRAGAHLDGYCRHLQVISEEEMRSRGEYAIELLTLGMILRYYETAAEATPGWVVGLARALRWGRRHVPLAKPALDQLCAALSWHFFAQAIETSRRMDSAPNPGAKRTASASRRLWRLILWLNATGEFEQEALRIRNWRSYLATMEWSSADGLLHTAVDLFDGFAREAIVKLGAYTEGVSQFLSGEYMRRGCREDQVFCGRTEAEYHLNMVSAEVMNRGLRETFESTTRKVVLVPTCMRGTHAAACKARVHGVDVICAACNPVCTVNRITRRMSNLGAQVYLVPHTTGFSRWLKRWERERDIGVTAVACLLNILPGGYEMRARRIASQCVPLDYSGCRKHWDRDGLPTGVNEDRLVQIVLGTRP